MKLREVEVARRGELTRFKFCYEDMSQDYVLWLDEEGAQKLMRKLWETGVRPSQEWVALGLLADAAAHSGTTMVGEGLAKEVSDFLGEVQKAGGEKLTAEREKREGDVRYSHEEVKAILCDGCRLAVQDIRDGGKQEFYHTLNGVHVECKANDWRNKVYAQRRGKHDERERAE